MAVVQGVGYPNPNRSHFRSMDIWHTARPDILSAPGWLGRYLDACQCGGDQPLPAVSVGDQLNSMFYADHTLVPAVASIGAFSFLTDSGDHNSRTLQMQTLHNIYNQAGNWPAYEDLIRQHHAQGARRLRRAAASRDGVSQPGRVPDEQSAGRSAPDGRPGHRRQSGHARLLGQLGGFDTHAAQFNQQANLFGQLGDALDAFMQDLAAMGKQDDVVIMTFSEFGRRVKQNGSNGTDHGTAEPMFIIGNQVTRGMYGTYPSLQDLDSNGDLKFNADFRNVYAAVLQDHLGTDAAPVLAGSYTPVNVIKSVAR